MNPNDPTQLARIRRAVDWSARKMEVFRTKRIDAIRQYVGTHYSNDGADQKVPVNLIELTVNTFLQLIAPKNPQVLTTTAHRQLKPGAARLELALNQLLRRLRFEYELREVVADSFYSLGVMKIGLRDDGATGQPFAQHVDFDDFVIDMAAKRYDQTEFIGDVYRVPLDVARENELYGKKARQALQAESKTAIDQQGQEQAKSISQGSDDQDDEYQDHVDLLDLHLPRAGLLVTIPRWGDAGPLRVAEYQGALRQPYRLLDFYRVPSQMMPLSPLAAWRDTHELANRLFRKFGDQADRQKTVTFYEYAEHKDAERVRDARDGEIIGVNRVDGIREARYGGVDPGTVGAFLQAKDIFSWLTTIETLGGLGPQAETFGQEKMIHGSASTRIAQMALRVIDFTRTVVEDLGWLIWSDPVTEHELVRKIPGTDLSVPDRFTPQDRQGNLSDYEIKIDPYSMQHLTPGDRLRLLTQFVTQIMIPLMPMMQQQGIALDLRGFTEQWRKLSGLDELEDILVHTAPAQEGGSEQRGSTSPNTTRTYERVNRPGATRSGNDQIMGRMMAGAGVQPDEMAALGRRTG